MFQECEYKLNEPYHLPDCSSIIRSLQRVAVVQGTTDLIFDVHS